MMRAAPWLGVLFLLAAAAWAPARASGPVFLDDLTWPELQERIRAGTTTIIIPVGATEQNGPHMVLGKHNVRVRALSARIAQALGNALVAPVVSYVPEGSINPPTAHMRFPGTITVPDAAFEQVIESAARSFRLHGFRDVVLLGDHGDYQKSLAKVAAKLNREWTASPARVHAILEYYRASGADYSQSLKSKGYSNEEIGTHAGLADTALALAVDPGLVRRDKLEAGGRGAPSNGVAGDPRRATAEIGQPGLDAIVATTVDAIRRATAKR
jgi:creatinine amidohydrolase/Fe(II)-dependent formamide hydrolase-like protein